MTNTLQDIIQKLEHFRSRIKMYIHPVDVSNTQSFLTGYTVAVQVFGIRRDRDLWWQVQESRGWKQAPVGPVPQMKERGMTEDQIINELINIEIEVLQRSNSAT